MSDRLKRAVSFSHDFFNELAQVEKERPASVGRCADHHLPLALLNMADVADIAYQADDSARDEYLNIIHRLKKLDAEYVPNPSKTNPSYDIIEEYFPDFERPVYEG
ncbi:MAG: hypothetical protein ACRBDL_02925 [Alphaproteobacteria bacterium]